MDRALPGVALGGAPIIEVPEQASRQLLPNHPSAGRGDKHLTSPGHVQRFLSRSAGYHHTSGSAITLRADAYRREMTFRFATRDDVIGLPAVSWPKPDQGCSVPHDTPSRST